MSRVVNKAKSYSPYVRKTSLQRAQQELTEKKDKLELLRKRSDEWAHEVRELRLTIQRINEYNHWLAVNYPKPEIIAAQRSASNDFAYKPLISVIMPVYNTNPSYLKTCIESVINQSYFNWELCIVDDASTKQETIETLKNFINLDPRIKFKRSKRNNHISISSNMAIKMATGEFIAILDHDDFLWPNALYEVVKLMQDHPDADFVYSDEDKINAEEKGEVHFAPYFKPDWSPHLLTCVNYITHLSVIRRSKVLEAGAFDKNMVGAQDWDLFLRLSEITGKIYHVAKILYSWRAHPHSTAMNIISKSYANANQRTALMNHFKRSQKDYKVQLQTRDDGLWYPNFDIKERPLISIVIPTKDKIDYLKRCIDSILDKTTYQKYEIVIVDTGSSEEATKEYYKHIKANISPKKIKFTHWRKQPFNYSDACNFGAEHSKGEYLVMLNNDTEVITETWLEDMLGYAQQKDIGAVGAKLYYPTMQIQHAGVTVGIGSREPVAGHIGINTDFDTNDFLTRMYANTMRDTTAVTAACLMVSAKKFWEVKGFDPKYRVTFNDVDLCLKFIKAGYSNIYLPFVELYHHESVSVGRVQQNRDMEEFDRSFKLIRKKWGNMMDAGDPYYNKNFYILSSNFGLAVHD